MEQLIYPSCEYMNISQDEYGSYSHANRAAIDECGFSSAAERKMYAPCTLKVVRFGDVNNQNWMFWTGCDANGNPEKKRYADGRVDFIGGVMIHQTKLWQYVGQIFKTGEVFYTTGLGGTTGRHCHMQVCNETYPKFTVNSQLAGEQHLRDVFSILDTTKIKSNKGGVWKVATSREVADYKEVELNAGSTITFVNDLRVLARSTPYGEKLGAVHAGAYPASAKTDINVGGYIWCKFSYPDFPGHPEVWSALIDNESALTEAPEPAPSEYVTKVQYTADMAALSDKLSALEKLNVELKAATDSKFTAIGEAVK